MSASPMPLPTPMSRRVPVDRAGLPMTASLVRRLDEVRRSMGGFWQAALLASALMMGAAPAVSEAAAPVVERTLPAGQERGEKTSRGGVMRVSAKASMARASNKASVADRTSSVGRKTRAASRASTGRDTARKRGATTATAASRSRSTGAQRLSRGSTRSRDARKAVSLSSGVPLNRAQRGVAQHISRKFRVREEAVEKYVSYAYQSGRVYNLDPHLILAVMATESSFNPRAESRVGAQGLMQVHTRVHKKRFKPYGSTNMVWQPKVNILVGSSILSDYMKRYGGSERRALKAYVGAANHKHDGGYGKKVLRRRDEFLSVTAAARRSTSQAAASQTRGSVDL
ncbi:MAG: transglycosylase SLT domain-containing protein [Lautropia sp.]|nr:transglycosylase SLT domain-containing protein [Lautropia sp.]